MMKYCSKCKASSVLVKADNDNLEKANIISAQVIANNAMYWNVKIYIMSGNKATGVM